MADFGDDLDLDAELLAVVQPKSGNGDAGKGDYSDDLSGDEDFDDGGFDEDPEDDDDDDDDDDSEDNGGRRHPDDPFDGEEDDEEDADDDDYEEGGSKKAKKKKKSSSKTAKKTGAQKKKRVVKKAKGSARHAPDGDDDDEDDENAVFTYDYDEQGYGDAEDRAKVMAMNEVERETLLAERVEQRQQQEALWQMTRDMKEKTAAKKKKSARSSTRTKPGKSKADAAVEALRSDKLAKKLSAQKRMAELSADEESDGSGGGSKRRRVRREGDDDVDAPGAEDMYLEEEDGPAFHYGDLVITKVESDSRAATHLLLPREQVLELASKPFFERAVKGLFVRVHLSVPVSQYVLCTIDSVKTVTFSAKAIYTGIRNNGNKMRLNKYLTLRIGSDTVSGISLTQISSKVPSEQEFATYLKRVREVGHRPLSRSELDKLLKHARTMTSSKTTSGAATAAESKAHISNQEFLYPERVNWTRKKGIAGLEVEARLKAYQAAKSGGDTGEISETMSKLEAAKKELSRIEERHAANMSGSALGEQSVFKKITERNEQVNLENERLAASRRQMESSGGTIDPFARFDTTGQSYFSIKPKAGTAAAASEGKVGKPEEESLKPQIGRSRGGPDDWKATLITWNRGRGKEDVALLGKKPLVAAYGGLFHGLQDFDVSPEELAARFPSEPFRPPVIDRLYRHQVQLGGDSAGLSKGSKAITLEEYNQRMRAE